MKWLKWFKRTEKKDESAYRAGEELKKYLPEYYPWSYPIATWELSTRDKVAHRQSLIKSLTATGNKYGFRDFIIRQLLPSDFGVANWSVPTDITPGEWRPWLKLQMDRDNIAVVSKVIMCGENPGVRTLRISRPPYVTRNIFNLTKLLSVLPVIKSVLTKDKKLIIEEYGGLENLQMEAYFTNPLTVFPHDIMHIDIQAVKNSADCELVIEGLILEQNGKTIAMEREQ